MKWEILIILVITIVVLLALCNIKEGQKIEREAEQAATAAAIKHIEAMNRLDQEYREKQNKIQGAR
ncbi:MAG: hypothetical protein IMZ62_00545 [Chloroflexi bacterium]|nr:hypothetical protein [Chloroflexota bacterium]